MPLSYWTLTLPSTVLACRINHLSIAPVLQPSLNDLFEGNGCGMEASQQELLQWVTWCPRGSYEISPLTSFSSQVLFPGPPTQVFLNRKAPCTTHCSASVQATYTYTAEMARNEERVLANPKGGEGQGNLWCQGDKEEAVCIHSLGATGTRKWK